EILGLSAGFHQARSGRVREPIASAARVFSNADAHSTRPLPARLHWRVLGRLPFFRRPHTSKPTATRSSALGWGTGIVATCMLKLSWSKAPRLNLACPVRVEALAIGNANPIGP